MKLSSVILSTWFSTAAFSQRSLQDLKVLLQRNPNIMTIDRFVEKLTPSLRSKPVIMHFSASLQGASHADPRVILFADDSDLIIAINGDTSMRGTKRVEIIELDSVGTRYNFAELKFRDGAPPSLNENPTVCAQCHGEEMLPIWEPYNLWVGALPRSDGISGYFEAKKVQEFMEAGPRKPRYRHLVDYHEYDFREGHPNNLLRKKLGDLNVKLFARKVRRTTHYQYYQHAIRAAVKDCEEIESFIPSQLAQRFARNYRQVFAETDIDMRYAFKAMARRQTFFQRMPVTRDFVRDVGTIEPMVKLRYVLERQRGSFDSWFISSEPNRYGAVTNRFMAKLLQEFGDDPDVCNTERSLLALRELMQLTDTPEASNLPPKDGKPARWSELIPNEGYNSAFRALVPVCAACHNGIGDQSQAGPTIPFTDPDGFKTWLTDARLADMRDRVTTDDQDRVMPPREPIHDKRLVRDFVGALTQIKGE